jgi:hypothetical protein
MSIVDEVMRISVMSERGANHEVADEPNQLEELEEVETMLDAIGVTLEPRFDISLAARIGAISTRK